MMGISFNRIILVGRLTRDPETKFATSGTQVSNFNLAVDRDYPKDSDNTDFIRIVAFGKTAEFVEKYMTKGKLVLVEGSLRINKWEKDGEKRSIPEVVASHVKFMETKSSSQGATVSHDEPESVEFFGSDDTEGSDSDEIPF